MTLEFESTVVATALPNVLVFDLVGVFGGNFDTSRAERLRAFAAPFFELSTMGLILDLGDHEVGQMAEFVGDDVQ